MVTTATTYTAAGAALNAGFSTLASQAAVSLINNQGDIGRTLNDLGSDESIKQIVASMLTAGVGQYYSGTYNLESLIAKTATGCVSGELSGSGCQQGAVSAGITSGLSWAANAMTQDQIANSKAFKGICIADTDNCSNNFTREEIGGGRWDLAKICRTGEFVCKVRDDGFVSISGYGIETSGKTVFAAIESVFNAKGQSLLSPMGGSQGSTIGYLKIFGIGPGYYEKGSFWAKLVETYGGPHDWLNSFSAYDTVNDPAYKMLRIDFDGSPMLGIDPTTITIPRAIGNISPNYGLVASFMNVIDIPLATPFAAAAALDKLPPGSFQSIQNLWKNHEQSRQKAQP